LRQENALSPLLFNFAVECAIKRVQAEQEGLKLNGTHQLSVYSDVIMWCESMYAIKKNTEALLVASKRNSVEVNGEKTKYMAMSRGQNAGQNCKIN